jgi:hypothetical protein
MPQNANAPSTVPAVPGAETVVEFESPSSTGKVDTTCARIASQKKRKAVTASAGGATFTVTGQVAKALQSLVRAGPRGITAHEVATWAYRLGAYVFTLRHDHGLIIEMEREPHDGGWHGRYVLRSPVSIQEAIP